MTKADESPNIAGLAEQDLPGPATFATRDESARGAIAAQGLLSRTENQNAPTSAISLIDAQPVESAPASSTGAMFVAPLAESRGRSLESVHDLVVQQAMRVQRSGSDALRVVLKPGVGTQLSLELRVRDGGIEAQAWLQRGDLDWLKQHWPELQQRLETRGVRLAPLTADADFSGGTNHFPRQPNQSPEHDALAAGAFAEFALAGSMTEPPAPRSARTARHRGWQSWA